MGTSTARAPRTLRAMVMVATLTASCALLADRLPDRPAPHPDLAAYVYGVGGGSDSTSARIPAKLNGKIIGSDDQYIPINYPALIPVDPSVADALPKLDDAIGDLPPGTNGVVVGYSEGAVVAELERRNLEGADHPPDKTALSFILIAGPSVPNGGIYARFPTRFVPGFSTTGPSQPTRYDTTYVSVQYDPIADFPAYFNPLAIANSLVAFFYSHGDASYDATDLQTSYTLVKTVQTNGAGGTDTYVLVPVEHLQLLEPIRRTSATLHTTELTEPIVGAVEPVLRVLIDMGYTDRTNANPEVPTPFAWRTPNEKFVEAAEAMPAAIHEGHANFQAGVQTLRSGLTAADRAPAPHSDNDQRDRRYLPDIADRPAFGSRLAQREPARKTLADLGTRPRAHPHDRRALR